MKRSVELALVALAFACFAFDLFHFTHHLRHDAPLLKLPGVREKLVWKAMMTVLALLLVISSRQTLWFLTVLGFCYLLAISPAFAGAGWGDCEQAREWMKESGIARDASEGFFGKLKIKSPRSTMPSEIDQVTWWGTFRPFEFWGSPEFQATWINPHGMPVGQKSFRGGPCQLAKATLRAKDLPGGEFEPGMWKVVVNCRDVVIDNHPFAVIGPAISAADKDSGVMIWADEVK